MSFYPSFERVRIFLSPAPNAFTQSNIPGIRTPSASSSGAWVRACPPIVDGLFIIKLDPNSPARESDLRLFDKVLTRDCKPWTRTCIGLVALVLVSGLVCR